MFLTDLILRRAENVNSLSYKIKKIKNIETLKKDNMSRIIEVKYLYELYGESMDEKVKMIVREFAQLYEKNRMEYRILCLKHKFLKTPLKRAMIQFVFCHK